MKRSRIVIGLFFISGLTALVYEILWVRLLGLVFGNTVQATTTVLAAFMAGLALGSFFVGRWLDRRTIDPLRVYAVLEFGIAVCAILFPLYLAALTPVYRMLYDSVEGSGFWLVFARFSTSIIFLMIPAGLMGGTLPALATSIVQRQDEVGQRLGVLYAVNTFGGVMGTVLCGFVLIPSLGAAWTNFLAAALNGLVALLAWRVSTITTEKRKQPEHPTKDPATPLPILSNAHRRVILAAYFTAGLAALALEVIWMRVLLLAFGSTTYAFTVMLAIFLSGIAIGSAMAERWVDQARDLKQWFGVLLWTSALVVLSMTALIDQLPVIYLEMVARFGLTWGGDIAARIIVSAILMLPPTIIFGSTFPVIAKLAVRDMAGLGRGVGTAYAANTVGAIAGSLLGGFALLPIFGMQRSIDIVAALIAITGMVVFGLTTQRSLNTKLFAIASMCVCVVALTLLIQPWDQKLLSAGVYLRPWMFLSPDGQIEIADRLWDDRLLHYEEGETSTVAVHLVHGISKTLTVDGKTEISTLAPDRRLGRLLGHLPSLLHPRPRIVFNLGLGGGFTAAALKAHPIDRLDVAEIEPRMIDAVEHFSSENRDLLDDRRVRLVFNDGRNHLLLTQERYDVITSDPLEPVVSGAANLFTREHFDNARQRLTTGGIMAQWVPLYELEPVQYESIVKTFSAVFPHVSVWFTGTDIILIGSEQPVPIDFQQLSERVEEPAVKEDLRDVGLDDPARILGCFLFEINNGGDFDADVPVNTDMFPYIEFAAPRQRWVGVLGRNLQLLHERKKSLPQNVRFPDAESEERAQRSFQSQQFTLQALIERERGDFAAAFGQAQQARALDPGNPWAREILVQYYENEGLRLREVNQTSAEMTQYHNILALDPDAIEGLLHLSMRSIEIGQIGEAENFLNHALRLHPDAPALRLTAARLLEAKGQTSEARQKLEQLLVDYPDFTPARSMLERLL